MYRCYIETRWLGYIESCWFACHCRLFATGPCMQLLISPDLRQCILDLLLLSRVEKPHHNVYVDGLARNAVRNLTCSVSVPVPSTNACKHQSLSGKLHLLPSAQRNGSTGSHHTMCVLDQLYLISKGSCLAFLWAIYQPSMLQ